MGVPTQDVAEAAAWLKRERNRRGWSTITLANEARAIARREGSLIKLTQQTVSGFEQPGTAKRMPEWLRYARMALEEGAQPEHSEVARRDELVYIREVDISYAMGTGSELVDYPDIEMVPFNLGFMQSLSRAETDRLFLARGFGDSMEPTLHKHDLVLIDTTEQRLGLGDTIFALSYAGAGYIKRLRPVRRSGEQKILLVSDNPSVPIEEADPDEVKIIGKVIWIGRKL